MAEEHNIGKTIAALRKKYGWTQAELAERLHVSDKAISKWESGTGLPKSMQFPALAAVFNVTTDYLMMGAEPKKEKVVMSQAEFCANTDDPTLLQEINPNFKDEKGKTLVDYMLQYRCNHVFIAFCEMRKGNISAFPLDVALEWCLLCNRPDLIKGATFNVTIDRGLRRQVAFEDESDILYLIPSSERNSFAPARLKVLKDSFFHFIATDGRINETTIEFLLGKQPNRECVWYLAYPYLIHAAYINGNTALLEQLLARTVENNEFGFNKWNNPYDPYSKRRRFASGDYFLMDRSTSLDKRYDKEKSYFARGYGFVRILKETIQIALERGDFAFEKRARSINSALKEHTGFDGYLANADEIRIAKLKQDKNITPQELTVQSAIREGVLNIDAVLITKDYALVESVLKKYPISMGEHLQTLFNAEDWHALSEWANKHRDRALEAAVDARNKEEIMRAILRHSGREVRSCEEIQKVWDKIAEESRKRKQDILIGLKLQLLKEETVQGLTKEYFENELVKGNIDRVIINLCVRLEAVLHTRYPDTETFDQMLSQYCKELDYDYPDDLSVLLNKLRIQRNNIVHPKTSDESLNLAEIRQCISHICNDNIFKALNR